MSTPIAALYVQKDGIYYGREGVDPWDVERDARKYRGPCPVVAHPPCNLWVNFAGLNFKRYGGAHNRPGNDEGCFAHALECVRKFGGVLEHPAKSFAWRTFNLEPPGRKWSFDAWNGVWVCEVSQCAYGHGARKRTWLCYSGPDPFDLRWDEPPATHQIGYFDVNKPVLSGKAASATPLAFAKELIRLARLAGSAPL